MIIMFMHSSVPAYPGPSCRDILLRLCHVIQRYMSYTRRCVIHYLAWCKFPQPFVVLVERWTLILLQCLSVTPKLVFFSTNTSCVHFLPESHLLLSFYSSSCTWEKILCSCRAELFFFFLIFKMSFCRLLVTSLFKEFLISLVSLYVSVDDGVN